MKIRKRTTSYHLATHTSPTQSVSRNNRPPSPTCGRSARALDGSPFYRSGCQEFYPICRQYCDIYLNNLCRIRIQQWCHTRCSYEVPDCPHFHVHERSLDRRCTSHLSPAWLEGKLKMKQRKREKWRVHLQTSWQVDYGIHRVVSALNAKEAQTSQGLSWLEEITMLTLWTCSGWHIII